MGKDARLRRISTGIKPNQIDAITATAIILSGVYRHMAKHGMNYASNQDQIKILMKNAWERYHVWEFTVDDVLKMWNDRNNGKPHTKQQVAGALQGLKGTGHVVITSGGPGKVGKYALSSVIEEMTDPKKDTHTPVGEKENSELETSTKTNEYSKAEMLIIELLMDFGKKLSERDAATMQAIEASDQTNKNFTEALEVLGRMVGKVVAGFDSHTVQLNANVESWTNFSQDVMANFREWDDFIKSYESGSSDQDLREAYRSGYKEGFKDGREDFKSEFKPAVTKELDKQYNLYSAPANQCIRHPGTETHVEGSDYCKRIDNSKGH